MAKKDKKIWDKFDLIVRRAVVYSQSASVNAKVDTIYPESFMIGLLTIGANEVTSTLMELDVDLDMCLKTLKKELEGKRSNNETEKPNFDYLKISEQIVEICDIADRVRSDVFVDEQISPKHIFLALLRSSDFIRNLFEKEGVSETVFMDGLRSVKAGDSSSRWGGHRNNSNSSSVKAIASFCIDVTQQAIENKLDPIIAREKEIEEAITILCRRGKNNPILLGEPGVGKTAIVEGISQRIVSGSVPKKILGCKLYSLNLSSLVAGTKYRGEFEERIQALVKEIQQSPENILFIDEIHTLVGAGSAAGGALDASNILKPFLARSELKCIGATTLDDYKKYFKQDGALTRRFQQIIVEEPTKEQTSQILYGIRQRFEEFHNCTISDDAISAIIDLSYRYMQDKNFPDKAIDCMDMACAKQTSWDHSRLKNNSNKNKNDNIVITADDIASVVSEQCKIPLEVILWDDNERIKRIEETLSKRVLGQKHAIDVVCRVLKNAYSGIRNPNRPIGSFVFGGETGTGKTHMAKELAVAIFGKDTSFIKLDMTEFSERHSVSKLIGSPPGYVGFQEIDVLVDKIKRKPYCIVLLDELEKAHPDVIKLFLQIMADGILTDAAGNKADFKNVILIMTGNFGLNVAKRDSLGFLSSEQNKDGFKDIQNRLVNYCKERYGAEFVNRIDEFVPFLKLDDVSLKKIVLIGLEELILRVENRNVKLNFTDKVSDLLVKMSKKEHGKNATVIRRLISKEIEICVSDALLSLGNKSLYTITIDTKKDQFIYRKIKEK